MVLKSEFQADSTVGEREFLVAEFTAGSTSRRKPSPAQSSTRRRGVEGKEGEARSRRGPAGGSSFGQALPRRNARRSGSFSPGRRNDDEAIGQRNAVSTDR